MSATRKEKDFFKGQLLDRLLVGYAHHDDTGIKTQELNELWKLLKSYTPSTRCRDFAALHQDLLKQTFEKRKPYLDLLVSEKKINTRKVELLEHVCLLYLIAHTYDSIEAHNRQLSIAKARNTERSLFQNTLNTLKDELFQNLETEVKESARRLTRKANSATSDIDECNKTALQQLTDYQTILDQFKKTELYNLENGITQLERDAKDENIGDVSHFDKNLEDLHTQLNDLTTKINSTIFPTFVKKIGNKPDHFSKKRTMSGEGKESKDVRAAQRTIHAVKKAFEFGYDDQAILPPAPAPHSIQREKPAAPKIETIIWVPTLNLATATTKVDTTISTYQAAVATEFKRYESALSEDAPLDEGIFDTDTIALVTEKLAIAQASDLAKKAKASSKKERERDQEIEKRLDRHFSSGNAAKAAAADAERAIHAFEAEFGSTPAATQREEKTTKPKSKNEISLCEKIKECANAQHTSFRKSKKWTAVADMIDSLFQNPLNVNLKERESSICIVENSKAVTVEKTSEQFKTEVLERSAQTTQSLKASLRDEQKRIESAYATAETSLQLEEEQTAGKKAALVELLENTRTRLENLNTTIHTKVQEIAAARSLSQSQTESKQASNVLLEEKQHLLAHSDRTSSRSQLNNTIFTPRSPISHRVGAVAGSLTGTAVTAVGTTAIVMAASSAKTAAIISTVGFLGFLASNPVGWGIGLGIAAAVLIAATATLCVKAHNIYTKNKLFDKTSDPAAKQRLHLKNEWLKSNEAPFKMSKDNRRGLLGAGLEIDTIKNEKGSYECHFVEEKDEDKSAQVNKVAIVYAPNNKSFFFSVKDSKNLIHQEPVESLDKNAIINQRKKILARIGK